MKPIDIKRLRKRLHLTQQELADIIGSQRHSVTRWELGVHSPRGAHLKILKELIAKSKKR